MRLRLTAAMAVMAVGFVSNAAQAAYVLNVEEVGSNVVGIGRGSFDLDGVTSLGGGSSSTIYTSASSGIFYVGGNVGVQNNYEAFDYISGPSSFGNGGGVANEATGPALGPVGVFGKLFIPTNYVSKTFITSTVTYNNATFASLGLDEGSYVYKFGSGSDIDTFTLNIGVGTVPLPSSAPMFGAALLSLAGLGYVVKRKKEAAAA